MENWMKSGEHMFIEEKPVVEHLMYKDYLKKLRMGLKESERCTYVMTTWQVVERMEAFAYTKDFPYVEIFNNA